MLQQDVNRIAQLKQEMSALVSNFENAQRIVERLKQPNVVGLSRSHQQFATQYVRDDNGAQCEKADE